MFRKESDAGKPHVRIFCEGRTLRGGGRLLDPSTIGSLGAIVLVVVNKDNLKALGSGALDIAKKVVKNSNLYY